MPNGLKSLARLLGKVPFAPAVAIMYGLVAAILILALPDPSLERLIQASGLGAGGAHPPGDVARLLAAVLALAALTLFLWPILGLAERLMEPRPAQSRGHRIEPDYDPDSAVIPFDAVIRRPLFAGADLGAPFMSDEAIALARDELVLDMLAPGEGAANPDPVEEVPDAQAGHEPGPSQAGHDRRSMQALLDRLERALERREHRTGSSAPILSGDMEALRQAIDDSGLRH